MAAILCCLFRHAEASARCYIKLYNKWAWALWTDWPHKPGRVTRSPTCGSNKMAPPSARHVGDTAFQWSSLKLKNKSNKHCPSLKGGPASDVSSYFYLLYLFFNNLIISIVFSTQHRKCRNSRILIILYSICSSFHKLYWVSVTDSWIFRHVLKTVTFTMVFIKCTDVVKCLNLSLNLAYL